MDTRSCFIHVLSPLHAGTGQAADLIDLPIARMKGSGIPFLPGSSIKGVLRDAAKTEGGMSEEELLAIFGPEQAKSETEHYAGALVSMDARLLCLPVRSFRGTFAYVTSPLLLRLAARDLKPAPGVAGVEPGRVVLTTGSVLGDGPQQKVYFEDLDLDVDAGQKADAWAERISKAVGSEIVMKRFAIVADEVMTFLWDTATQLDQRVRIDPQSRTVVDGALWTEESLPAETILVGMLGAEHTRKQGTRLSPAAVLDKVLTPERILQFGGKATVGRGRCRLLAA